MPFLASILIAFFSVCSVFVASAEAQPGLPMPNSSLRPMSPTSWQPYPVVQPLYYADALRRPLHQAATTESINQLTWTQKVIGQANRFHDFKTVARGMKSEHRFELYNPCSENLHIASVSASCTCVTPFLLDEKNELQTYEKTAVVARFHTEAHEGLKSATITVIIDKPQYAEIQLNIQGNIRSDISVTPNEVRFGPVAEGMGAERTVEVVYTGGMANWRIVDFTCSNKNLSAAFLPGSATPGRISSKVKIKLAADTPQGIVNERFYLISNDMDARRELPILVSATVGKVLTVTPQTQFLGFLKPGQESAKKNTVLRCTEPFKITKIECSDPNIEIAFTPNPDAPASRIYQIPVKFNNPPDGSPKLKDGTLHAAVLIETDDPKQKASFNVTAKVVGE